MEVLNYSICPVARWHDISPNSDSLVHFYLRRWRYAEKYTRYKTHNGECTRWARRCRVPDNPARNFCHYNLLVAWGDREVGLRYLEDIANNKMYLVRPILRFINLAFLVMPGASLEFDMPETLFGPNDNVSRVFRSGELSVIERLERITSDYYHCCIAILTTMHSWMLLLSRQQKTGFRSSNSISGGLFSFVFFAALLYATKAYHRIETC